MNNLAHQLKLTDVIDEYVAKLENTAQAIEDYENACKKLKAAACVYGTFGNTHIDTGHGIHERCLQESLTKSAWRHVYNGLNIGKIATANDKRRLDMMMENPPPFIMDNIKEQFGDYILNPWDNILRGLAETFSSLDPAYKSHDRVRIGVKGLPKRVILSNVGGYGDYGTDRLVNVINALGKYQGKELFEWKDALEILKDGEAFKSSRGVWLKRFGNGNGHLFFDKYALQDINRGLAEYYGEVLADTTDGEKTQSTAVSKDLQYYPTPQKVAEKIVSDSYVRKGDRVLEPSCGCGRILDELVKAGADCLGIEVNPIHARTAREKGHKVHIANFLETVPTGDYDHVVMNPPFYGKHYAKHVQHALKFLKPDGFLTAILPATARYDHGLLDGQWTDLPVGSFSESGTNVNTSILTIRKRNG